MPSKVDLTMAALDEFEGSIQDRLSQYYKSQLSTPPVPWVDPDPTAFAPIAGITENFETGVNGTAITTGNTIFDNVSLGGSGTAIIITAAGLGSPIYAGTRSMHIRSFGANPIVTADISPSVASAWFAFAFRTTSAPTSAGAIFNCFSTAPATISSLRLGADLTLTFRDGATNRSSSPALALNTWYEIHVRLTPGTNGQFIIYNQDQSVFYTSPTQTLNATGPIGDIRFGSFTGGEANIQYTYDSIRGDTAREPRHVYWVQPPDTPGTEMDTHNMSSADMQVAIGYDQVTDMREVEDL